MGHACAGDAAALEVLEAALERETDPLVYCALQFGIDQAVVMERAARWAGFAFHEVVPPSLAGQMTPTRLGGFCDIRVARTQLFGNQIAFAAPDFMGLLRLRKAGAASPDLRRRICLVPYAALQDYLVAAASEALIASARQTLTRHWPYATAQLELTKIVRHAFLIAMVLLVGLLLLAPFMAQAWLLPLSMVLLLGPAVIRWLAILTPPAPQQDVHRPDDGELPTYSILIPLRGEAAMVPQLFAAMRALDYPADRLDIKFVVESRSPETVAAVRARLGEVQFSMVIVPDAAPRTKPKAIDFALPLCRGDFVVVYDAEDVPDPDQPWKAAMRFRDEPDIVCLQARLVIDNANHNWLTALFAGEYAGVFDVLLPALARWRLPVPLGGTSNHFDLAALRSVGGWDAYNVTEDADLGIRLARRRMRVEVLASATREAAHTTLSPWMGQRTRWMKGWMQTFIVHNRDPVRLLAEMGPLPMLSFIVLVLGMIIAPFLHSGFLLIALGHALNGTPILHLDSWGGLYLMLLVVGYGSAIAISAVGLWRQRRPHLLLSTLLLPLYWLLMAVATAKALRELLVRPFYWFKSPHRPRRGRAETSVNAPPVRVESKR